MQPTSENACGLEGGRSRSGIAFSMILGAGSEPMIGAFGTDAE